MNAFDQAGEAMLMAQEGKLLIARALVATIQGWVSSFKSYVGGMPTTLPPTESVRR
ncbi:hypothetical protein [Acidisphaera sp. L21]|uniref:hypothetical protein n=1 Tax=Acidisphaera sp. L21 TaxID=1641851 RepID=UPI00131C2CB1|nr:hypothetical protein [Acidisphaera sp. L21]